jgi:3-deoxy-manno-octulosonate cytidylyltransferase (CMP-KDO synthetase)
MKVIAVIPARLASTRLPRKMLREIGGQLLIARVYHAVRSSPLVDDVIVATDSREIIEVCSQNGWRAQMTSAAHRSGTERVQEVSDTFPAEVYVGVMKNSAAQVGTLKTPCGPSDIHNPNAVKVVTDAAGRALYFSRATVPYDRDGAGSRHFKHLGFYAYRKTALDSFIALPESMLERSERLEQLRFLENGIPIHVGETPYDTVGVDTEEDLRRVEEILRGQ